MGRRWCAYTFDEPGAERVRDRSEIGIIKPPVFVGPDKATCDALSTLGRARHFERLAAREARRKANMAYVDPHIARAEKRAHFAQVARERLARAMTVTPSPVKPEPVIVSEHKPKRRRVSKEG